MNVRATPSAKTSSTSPCTIAIKQIAHVLAP
jgi:hypothetical protein